MNWIRDCEAYLTVPECDAPGAASLVACGFRERGFHILSFSSSVGVAMKNRSGRSGRMFNTLLGKSLRRSSLARTLRSERLENRHMMAGDTYQPYHNDLIPEDTNQDYNVTALDALLVINAINSGELSTLPTDGVGKAEGPRIDVSGDNMLTPLDALQVINVLNGEGAAGDLVGFSYQLTDIAGQPLSNNTASVGQLVQLRTFVQDLRGLSAKGVFTAFLDMNYSDGTKFQVNVGEGQSFRYDFDRISSDPSSFFTFTFNGQTTAPINLFAPDGSGRTGSDLAPLFQAALEGLSNIGAGNVVVREDAAANNADNTANRLRNNFDIIFTNSLAGQDVSLITVNTAGIVMQPGQTLTFDLVDKYPANPNDPKALAAAFFFTNEFTTGRNATLGTEGGVSQFDEVGATGGLGAPSSPGARRLFFTVTLKTLAAGTVTFTPNEAEDLPAHDILVFPKDIVPTSLVEYGEPFTLTIASSLVANNDAFPVVEDAVAAQYNVTTNDTVLSGGAFTITSLGQPNNGGTVSIAPGSSQVIYTPAANFSGVETFTYTITNSAGSATGTVTMTVSAVNDPISVPNQTAATNLGKPVTRTTAELTQGGSAGPGESSQVLSIASVNSPSSNGGSVALQSGSVVYTPAAGFSGTDTFTIVVTDNGQTNGANDFKTQLVTVVVTVTNDPPSAVNDLIDTVDEETTNNSLDVLANDTAGANDFNDSLTITAVGGSPTGTVTIASDGKTLLYTPAASFVGQDTFTYTVRDTGGATATATVVVDVQATVLPRARVDQAQSTEDTTTPTVINVLGNDRTTAGASATLVSFSQPANGTVTLNDNGTPAILTDDTLSYLPNPNFSGNDIFTYVMNESPNAGGVNSTGTVTVAVAAVNDPPVIANDTATATEGAVTTIPASALLGNDSPGVGETTQQTLTITAAQAVTANGGSVAVLAGNVVYTPAQDFNGEFVFTYTATDNGSPAQSGTGTVTVTVAAVNDAPIAANDTDTTAEGTAKTIALLSLTSNDKPGPATATDEASQTLTVVAVSPTSANGGTVTLGANGVVYTPSSEFNGVDTFTYTVRDNGSPTAEASATVTITVTAVNDAPTAGGDSVGTSKGLAVTISPTTLLANDSPGPANESGQTLTITGVSTPVNGTVALVGGQIVFTPADGYSGDGASFQYTITDNGQTNGSNDFKTATGLVSVKVQDFQPSTLTGTVYVDETNDGSKQAAERTLGGVTINLVGTALGNSISRSFVTLADGSYSFGNLAPGVYTVSIVNPTLMIDGLDTAGSLGDSDGVANDNSFTFTVAAPGGLTASGYNFGLIGVTDGYATTMERLASRYFAAGSAAANNGVYAVLGSDGSQQWFSRLNGYDDIVFAEIAMNSTGTECTLTIVDSAHNVRTTTLGKGRFLTMYDNAGNTIIRVLGGLSQLSFTNVNLATPPVRSTSHFLDAIDEIFAQQGW